MSITLHALNFDTTRPETIGGINVINDKLRNNQYTYSFIRDIGPFTMPMFKAVEWITDSCDDWRLSPDNLPPDIEILSTIRGMQKPLSYKKWAYIDGSGRVQRETVDAYQLVRDLGILEDTPEDVNKILRIEQILTYASLKWPSYAVLWDAVHHTKNNHMGSIRPWVLEELERLGLGIPVIGQKAPKGERIPPGRPPVVIAPTTWGIRLVQLGDTAGEQFRVTDAMRVKSRRVQSAIVPHIPRIPNPYSDRYLKLEK